MSSINNAFILSLLITINLYITKSRCVFYCNYQKCNVTVKHDVSITIKCNNNITYDELKINLSNSSCSKTTTGTIDIRNCPLPDDGGSIGSIPQQLGIKSYRRLRFHNNNLNTNLTKHHFSNLTTLTYFELHSNLIELPSNIFQNIDTLEYLKIGHKLKHITRNVFGAAANLRILNLEQNYIETFPSDVFESLINLTFVKLGLNNIQTLPANLLKNNVNLQTFILTKNRVPLKHLPDNLLAKLPKLQEVHLQCDLGDVKENLFYNSKNIKTIIMSHNKLEILAEKLFETQINLKELDLSNNHLKILPKNLLEKTTNLEQLKLSNNQLASITSDHLKCLQNLIVLELKNNQLTSIQPSTTNYNLKKLLLNNNSITTLVKLYLHLPESLEILDLSYNQITKLNGKKMEYLSTKKLTLNLTHNHIKTIENFEPFKSTSETRIITTDLDNNPLKCDCNLLGSLKYLNGSYKPLQFYADHLICNEPLTLKGNLVNQLNPKELLCPFEKEECPKKCKCWLRTVDNILMINCTYGNFSKIPKLSEIGKLNLKGIELCMENNQLMELPSKHTEETIGYENVTKLYLANNSLSNINKYQIPKYLTTLDVTGNNLKSLNFEILDFMNASKGFKHILLSNNPWICECDKTSLNLYRFTQINNPKFTDSSKMICSDNRKVHELRDYCDGVDIIFIALSAILILIFILFTLYYKFQREIKIWLYSHNMCLWFLTNDDSDDDKLYDAYISYSNKDEDFITQHLIQELEFGYPPFKLCIQERDWLIGESIPDNIVRSIANSKRTIAVLSKNYLQSEWCKMEFKLAHSSTLTDNRQRIIIIIYDDIDEMENLDPDLKSYLTMGIYEKWGSSSFWSNLRYAMPHHKLYQRSRCENLIIKFINLLRQWFIRIKNYLQCMCN